MKTIALFGKTLSPENGEYMRQLFKELADNHVEIVVYQHFADIVSTYVPIGVQYTIFHSHEDLKADLLFSIGGDGTILDTVPFVLDSGIPVLGINMGRLGFLSSVSKNEIAMAVNSAAPAGLEGSAALRPDMLAVEADPIGVRHDVGIEHDVGTAALNRVGARPEIRE